MITDLEDQAKVFRDSDLEVVGLDSIKEFNCPVCRGTLEMTRRVTKHKNAVVIRISSKDRKVSREPQYVMYPKL